MSQLAIVITAYNRATSLKNLLKSLSNLHTSVDVPLVISIDNQGTEQVNKVAEEFEWHYGEKKVIIHNEKKGLVNHFIWVGDQTEVYDNVLFLEDDLLVSPNLIDCATQIIDFYSKDQKIAAASLYNPIICEMTGERFYQIEDGFDFYFLQQPYWGNIWFKDSWREFSNYLLKYQEKKELLPKPIAQWTESFKKIYIQYLVEKDKYVVTSRSSIVNNLGIAGLHSGQGQYHAQNTMLLEKVKYRLCNIQNSSAVYDAFLELNSAILKKYNPELKNYSFTVDTKGLHHTYTHPYVLTTKPVKKSIKEFSSLMKPTELSIILGQRGDSNLKLSRREDVIESRLYYFKRRYLDIKKNYWVGINAGLCITIATLRRIASVTWSRLIGFNIRNK